MKTLSILYGFTCMSLFLAAVTSAEILGVQPGTSNNPKDNVPNEIQRGTPGGKSFGPGGSGPGSRSDALVRGMGEEKPLPVTKQELEENAEQGGGAAVKAEVLKEKSEHQSKRP